ncbi:MAG: hypothetical protein WD181_07095 [Solirubrobacterales bacterium]
MRVATMVIALVLMVVVFVQSCAVSVGGSIAEDEDMAGGGALGIMLALTWVVGAGLVLSRPKAAIWAFGVGAFFGLIGATAGGFSDLWIWTFVSVILGVMSWRGIREREKKEAEESARYQADIAAGIEQARRAGAEPTISDDQSSL